VQRTPSPETMVAFWSPAHIAEALRSDALSERDKLHLLVASFVFANLFGSLGIVYTWRMPLLLVTSLLGLAITLIGLYAAFRANQRGDGVRFVERLTCLGFPVGARVFAAFYGGYWLLAGIGSGHWGWPNEMSPGFWTQWAVVYVLVTSFFWRGVRKYVQVAARPAAA
jgi:hypothetical protein